MPDAVTDIHGLIWYLQDDERLSVPARQYFEGCEQDGCRIRVPSICVVEIIYLAEKGRIPADTLHQLLTEFSAPDTVLEIISLDLSVVLDMRSVRRAAVPDMPDRIIAATAVSLRLPLISRDRKIQLAGLATVW